MRSRDCDRTCWLLTGVCATLGLVDAWVLFSPEMKVMLWPDSIAYLIPAADAMEFGYFSHAGSRGFVYPGVLWLLLQMNESPWIIVAIQRLFAFGTFVCLAAAIALIARRAPLRLPAAPWLVALVAAFWLAVYVLYPPTAALAHAIAPETLASLLLIVTVGSSALTAWAASIPRVVGLSVTAVSASSALVLVRPHWQLAAILLPAMLPFVAPAGRRKLVAGTTAASVAASLLVFAVPEYRLRQRYDRYLSEIVGPRHLFCSSADLVFDYLSTHRSDEFSRRITQALGRILAPDARARATDWTLLGFNADDCTHGETTRLIAERFGHDPAAETRYYVTTYLRALAVDPAYLPARVARNFITLAPRPFAAVATDYWVRHDDSVLVANVESRALFRAWAGRDRALFSGTVQLPTRRWPLASRVFFAAAGALLCAAAGGAIVRVFVAKGRWWQPPLVRAFAVTLGLVAATNALIAIVHTFEPRYLAMQVPIFALLGFLASLLTLDLVAWRRRDSPAG